MIKVVKVCGEVLGVCECGNAEILEFSNTTKYGDGYDCTCAECGSYMVIKEHSTDHLEVYSDTPKGDSISLDISINEQSFLDANFTVSDKVFYTSKETDEKFILIDGWMVFQRISEKGDL